MRRMVSPVRIQVKPVRPQVRLLGRPSAPEGMRRMRPEQTLRCPAFIGRWRRTLRYSLADGIRVQVRRAASPRRPRPDVLYENPTPEEGAVGQVAARVRRRCGTRIYPLAPGERPQLALHGQADSSQNVTPTRPCAQS